MTLNETDAFNASDDTSLLTQLAELDVELANALQLQQDTNQASNWSYYAWTTTDGFIERTKSQDLIKRFEKQSIEADALKVLADALVKDLRDRKRKLTRQLKSKAYSMEMQAATNKAVEKSANTAIAVAETLEKAKAKETHSTSHVFDKNALQLDSVESLVEQNRVKAQKVNKQALVINSVEKSKLPQKRANAKSA